MTCDEFGVILHMRGDEGLTCKVGYPITELVVMLRDEAALFAVQGMKNRESFPTPITMG